MEPDMAEKLLDDPEFRFGAWLVTCYPDVYDLAGLHEQGYRSVANWRVQPSYRTDRMGAGDRIVLWMSASPGGPAAGVWGIGRVLGPVEAAPVDPSPRFAWMDRSEQGRMDHVVETDLRLLDEPIPADRVQADPRFRDAEIVAANHLPNPQVLSAGEWDAVAGLLPHGWPDPARWAELDPAGLPDPGGEPLDARFDAVTAAELAAATGVDAEVVERVLVNQFEELEACYAAGDLIVTDLSYYCLDDELLRQAQEIEDSIDAERDGAVDELVERLEDLAGDRLVLVPNDLPETPGFLDGTGATEEQAEQVLDAYWDLVLEQPARLDPFWLAAAEEAGVEGDGLGGRP
jgi:hypothetical protein